MINISSLLKIITMFHLTVLLLFGVGYSVHAAQKKNVLMVRLDVSSSAVLVWFECTARNTSANLTSKSKCFITFLVLSLFKKIAVDDLRTQMSPYPEGGSYMHTPNMERIAATAVVFERTSVAHPLPHPLITGSISVN